MIKYYYEDKYKTELDTKLTETFEDNNKYFVKLEDSIYYPQGGGQKGDKGYIVIDNERYNIINTVKDENFNSVLILDKPVDPKYIGSEVKCYLDMDYRFRQMRLHTALHLYHMVIEKVKGSTLDYPTASNIEDGFAYNKYNDSSFDVNILDEVTKAFNELIKTKETVITYPDKENPNYRYYECMNYIIPCGGIHVDTIDQIGDLKIEVSHKKKVITIKMIIA